MRNLTKKIVAVALSLLVVMSGAMPVFAKSMEEFPYQNQKHCDPSYTRCIQVIMMNFNSTTRAYIRDNGGVDASYGPATAKAVTAFQAAKGLDQDGSCGPKTWKALRQTLRSNGTSGSYYLYKGPYPISTNCMKQYQSSTGVWHCYNNFDSKWYPVG